MSHHLNNMASIHIRNNSYIKIRATNVNNLKTAANFGFKEITMYQVNLTEDLPKIASDDLQKLWESVEYLDIQLCTVDEYIFDFILKLERLRKLKLNVVDVRFNNVENGDDLSNSMSGISINNANELHDIETNIKHLKLYYTKAIKILCKQPSGLRFFKTIQQSMDGFEIVFGDFDNEHYEWFESLNFELINLNIKIMLQSVDFNILEKFFRKITNAEKEKQEFNCMKKFKFEFEQSGPATGLNTIDFRNMRNLEVMILALRILKYKCLYKFKYKIIFT